MPEEAADRHLGFSGSILPVSAICLAITLTGLGFATGHHLSTALGVFCALLTILGLELRGRLLRSKHQQDSLDFASHVLGSAIVAWMLTALAVGFAYRPLENFVPTWGGSIALVGVSVTAGLIWALKIYYSLARSTALSWSAEVIPWLRMGLALSGAAFLGIAACELGFVATDTAFVRVSMLCAAIPTVEWTFRALKRRNGFPPLIGNSTTVTLLFGDKNPIDALFDLAHKRLGIDLHSTWALSVFRRSLEPVLVSTLVLAWVSTAVVPIATHDAGLVERLGAPKEGPSLGPGLHLKAPWPVDRVHRVNVAEIHSIALGFFGARKGASLLWTKEHADEEYNLLLGDGRDLITVNAILNYQISHPRDWRYATQNPHESVQSVAEQVLLRNTVDKSLEDVLSENLSIFATQIQNGIQAQADALSLGVDILSLSLQGLHPPVAVAADYQTVVSAQHEMETQIFAADTDQIERVSAARREALLIRSDAKKKTFERLATGRGEADAFSRVAASFAMVPDLYTFRRRLEALEAQLSNRPLNVIDDRITDTGGALWLLD